MGCLAEGNRGASYIRCDACRRTFDDARRRNREPNRLWAITLEPDRRYEGVADALRHDAEEIVRDRECGDEGGCGKRGRATKWYKYATLPALVVVYLRRFSPVAGQKLTSARVPIEVDLDLGEYLDTAPRAPAETIDLEETATSAALGEPTRTQDPAVDRPTGAAPPAPIHIHSDNEAVGKAAADAGATADGTEAPGFPPGSVSAPVGGQGRTSALVPSEKELGPKAHLESSTRAPVAQGDLETVRTSAAPGEPTLSEEPAVDRPTETAPPAPRHIHSDDAPVVQSATDAGATADGTEAPGLPPRSLSAPYRVRAVVEHLGETCDAGHYRTWVRVDSSATGNNARGGAWTLYDDRSVSPGHPALPPTVASNACLVFYERHDGAETPPEDEETTEDTPATGPNADLDPMEPRNVDADGDVIMETAL